MTDGTLEVQIERRAGAVRVIPRGVVDLMTAPVLESALRQATCRPAAAVVVEMSDVDFPDSRGVGALAKARAVLSETAVPLVVTGARGPVRKILRLCDGVGPS